MASVLLMYGPANTGISLLILSGDGKGVILLGSVVDYKYLNPISADKY